MINRKTTTTNNKMYYTPFQWQVKSIQKRKCMWNTIFLFFSYYYVNKLHSTFLSRTLSSCTAHSSLLSVLYPAMLTIKYVWACSSSGTNSSCAIKKWSHAVMASLVFFLIDWSALPLKNYHMLLIVCFSKVHKLE